MVDPLGAGRRLDRADGMRFDVSGLQASGLVVAYLVHERVVLFLGLQVHP
jgi:hypothetical protein